MKRGLLSKTVLRPYSTARSKKTGGSCGVRLSMTLWAFALSGTVAACGSSFEVTEDTVYVKKQGNVLGASIEDFNEDYYDEEELKAYVTESVENYVALNGDGSVELNRFEVAEAKESGKLAQLYLDYGSYIDYAQFNGVELYAGTVPDAIKAGYAFDQDFKKVADGKIADAADSEEILADEEAKVVILGQEMALRIDGQIMYVSDGNVEVTGKSTAKLHYDMEDADAKPAYVVYK